MARQKQSSSGGLKREIAEFLPPFEPFIKDQRTASILLLFCTLLALVVANSDLNQLYQRLLTSELGFVFGDVAYSMSVHHWINDGLMALFFFVLGLEMKRELLAGDLRHRDRFVPVAVAAIGGMIAPGLIYASLNFDGPSAAGWAIPMATDTAFAIGVLALLGNRVPAALATFLLALAIIDDMGAVVIIAIYYSDAISTLNILVAAGLLVALAAANYLEVRRPVVYLLGGVSVWLAMLGSGVHATLAGILVAATIPARPARGSREFLQRIRRLTARFEDLVRGDAAAKPILAAPEKLEVVEEVQQTAEDAATPLQLWERTLEHPIALLVLPLFALANAGVALDFGAFAGLFTQPLTLGIVLGLVAGKALGITLAAFTAIRLGIGELPEGIRMRHLPGLGLIAGVGFTMSVFIASLGFRGDPELLALAKLGILTGSLIAGTLGFIALRMVTNPDRGN